MSKLKRKEYEKLLEPIQQELVGIARWVAATGQRVVVLFEGRDTAGKGGAIGAVADQLGVEAAVRGVVDVLVEDAEHVVADRRAGAVAVDAEGGGALVDLGEDEADPKAGSISFVAPVARSLMGKAVGDVVGASGQELEILAIS